MSLRLQMLLTAQDQISPALKRVLVDGKGAGAGVSAAFKDASAAADKAGSAALRAAAAADKFGDAGRRAGSSGARSLRDAADAADRTADRMGRAAAAAEKLGRATAALRNAADIAQLSQTATAAAQGLQTAGGAMVREAMDAKRMEGVLRTVRFADAKGWGDSSKRMRSQFAGVDDIDMGRGIYQFKSAIQGITDEQAIRGSEVAALVGKVSLGSAAAASDLMATSHAIFKNQQFNNLTDAQFIETFGSMMLGAVEQFKLTGPKIQAAMQAVGGTAAQAGMSMAEQAAAIGMMGASMEGGVVGTALRAYSGKIFDAEKALNAEAKDGPNKTRVSLIDKKTGQGKDIASVIEELKKRYGASLQANEKSELAKALGSEEALKVIEAFWDRTDELRANTKAMTAAGSKGMAGVEEKARDMDKNDAAGIDIHRQRLTDAAGDVGEHILPVLQRLGDHLSPLAEKLAALAAESPGAAAGLAALGVGIVGIAAVAGPMMGGAALAKGVGSLLPGRGGKPGAGLLAAAGPDIAGRLGGGVSGPTPVMITNWPSGGLGGLGDVAGSGQGGKGPAAAKPSRFGRVAGMAGKVAVPLAIAAAAYDGYGAMVDGDTVGVAKAAGGLGGGMAGAWAGGAAGAAIGSVVPVVGTAVGAVVGSVVGGFVGSELGATAMEYAAEKWDVISETTAAAVNSAGTMATEAASAVGNKASAAWNWLFGDDDPAKASPGQAAATAPLPPPPATTQPPSTPPDSRPAAAGAGPTATTVSAPISIVVHTAYGQEAQALRALILNDVQAMLAAAMARTQGADEDLYEAR